MCLKIIAFEKKFHETAWSRLHPYKQRRGPVNECCETHLYNVYLILPLLELPSFPGQQKVRVFDLLPEA